MRLIDEEVQSQHGDGSDRLESINITHSRALLSAVPPRDPASLRRLFCVNRQRGGGNEFSETGHTVLNSSGFFHQVAAQPESIAPAE